MAVDFCCEHCGGLLNVEIKQVQTVQCRHCGKNVAVPAVLISAPRLEVPQEQVVAPPVQPIAFAPQISAVQPTYSLPAAAVQFPTADIANLDQRQRRALFAGFMPWVLSLLFHVSVVVLMLLVTMYVVENRQAADIIVPEAVLAADPSVQMVPGEVGRGATPQDKPPAPAADSRGYSRRESSISAGSGDIKKVELIGPGGGVGGGSPISSGLTGSGGSGAGPRSNFFGTGGNAHYVVYVIDRSGSMYDTFEYVRQEMLNSISKLQPTQSFHVIMFADGPPIEMGSKRMVPATKEYKIEAADFLSAVKPQGRTDPIPALMQAFAALRQADKSRSGKLVYLLTDGVFPDNEKVLEAIRSANKDKGILINTYLYGGRPQPAVDVLTKIAEQNGGRFKYINPDE